MSCRSPAAALAVLWTMMYGRVISTNLLRPQFAHTRTHGHINLGHRLTAIMPSETFLKPLVCVLILLAQPITDSFYSHAHDKAKFNDQLWKIDIDWTNHRHNFAPHIRLRPWAPSGYLKCTSARFALRDIYDSHLGPNTQNSFQSHKTWEKGFLYAYGLTDWY